MIIIKLLNNQKEFKMKKMILVLIPMLLAFTAQAQQRKAAPAPKMVTPSYEQPTTTYSWSNGFTHELDVNLSSGYLRSYKSGSKSITDFNVFASYSYDFRSSIQLGADIGFSSFDSESRFTLAGTGTYNFDSDYSNAFFAKGGVGLYPVTKTSSTGKLENKNEIGIYIAGGKRFKIWDHVNYKPGISVQKVSDNDAEFTIQFFNISLNTSYLF